MTDDHQESSVTSVHDVLMAAIKAPLTWKTVRALGAGPVKLAIRNGLLRERGSVLVPTPLGRRRAGMDLRDDLPIG